MAHHKNLPTIIGYSLALVTFIVLAVTGLAYATGYRLDWREFRVEKTGVLAVTTKPAGASVWVAGKQYSKKTPLAIRNIVAGSYEVRVKLADYQDYVANVDVVSGEATEISAVDMVLSKPESKVVAQDVVLTAPSGNDVLYRTKDKKWWLATDAGGRELTFDKIPTHVKTALTKSTKVDWVKKSSAGNTWSASLTVDGKKWLAVFDPEGFRGALLATPLNQAPESGFEFIDNDHLLGTVNGTVYALDLTTNKLSTVAKNVLATQVWGGRVLVFAKGATGETVVTADGNVFDDRPGEVMKWLIPAGRDPHFVEEVDNEMILSINTGGSDTLWLIPTKEDGEKKQVRVGTDFRGLSVNKDKKYFIYASGDGLKKYSLTDGKETVLRSYPKDKPTILGQRDASIFVQTRDGVEIVDLLGQNAYLIQGGKPKVFLGDDSRMFWVLDTTTLGQWVVRKNQGIFGVLTRGILTSS